MSAELAERLTHRLRSARRALLLGVGGGNDAVSALMMRAQLERDFGFAPEVADIAAVLPDLLDYADTGPGPHPLAPVIRPQTRRILYGISMWSFPEPLLAAHKADFGVRDVIGLKMTRGPAGLTDALDALAADRGYDLLLALDVGGDFIAAPENLDVLSPMMDAWCLLALRELAVRRPGLPTVFGVFGLGTDAESTPAMLDRALARLGDRYVGRFDAGAMAKAAEFYRSVIEPNRRSNTAARTIRHIEGAGRPETSVRHRLRFHVNVNRSRLETRTALFDHPLDPAHAGRYVLFDDPSGIANPFAVPCRNGVEWFVKVRRLGRGPNHELNGYGYDDLADKLGLPAGARPHRLFFGTPCPRFSPDQRRAIAADVVESVRNGFHDLAFLDVDDLGDQPTGELLRTALPTDLVLVARPECADLATRLAALVVGWAE